MLDDVSTLLVILVVGRTISYNLPNDDDVTLLSHTLRVTAAEAHDELRLARGCSIRLE